MKINRVRKRLELIAAILALCYCALDFVLELVNIISISSYFQQLDTAYLVGLIIGVGLVATELILAIKLIDIQRVEYKFLQEGKGIRIAFIVITSVLVFFLLISAINGTGSFISVLALLIFIAVDVLESTALGMQDTSLHNKTNYSIATTEVAPSIDSKIGELKHLLELGAITQEQYESAVQKIINSII